MEFAFFGVALGPIEQITHDIIPFDFTVFLLPVQRHAEIGIGAGFRVIQVFIVMFGRECLRTDFFGVRDIVGVDAHVLDGHAGGHVERSFVERLFEGHSLVKCGLELVLHRLAHDGVHDFVETVASGKAF